MSFSELDNIDPARLGELMLRSRQLNEDDLRPAEIEGYQILEPLGEGGSGTVWRARQISTGRIVAIKLLQAAALGSFKARQRFEREVELTARLVHPGIARLYDSGTRRGVWFYAMELIEGRPLDQYVTQAKLSQRRVLELLVDVCRAVQHAHERGIIHRDLKPSNILVSDDGRPHVLDFGLAQATPEVRSGLTISRIGEISGTLGFMSPEQASGRADAVDTRSDVYGVGSILFLLLTGRPPRDLSGPRIDVIRRIAESEAVRPRSICSAIDGELETVLLKALAHEPSRRYTSAAALADDIERYLNGDPLMARRPTLAYFVGRQVRKYRLPLIAAGFAIAAMIGMAAYAYARIARERNVALARGIEAVRQRALAEQSRELAENRLADSLLAQADALAEVQRWAKAKELYMEAWQKLESLRRPTFPAQLGLFAAYQVARPPLKEFVGGKRAIKATALSPDGSLAAAGGQDTVVRVWDVRTAHLLQKITDHHADIRSLAFSPDSRRLFSGDGQGMLIMYDVQTGRKLWSYAQGEMVLEVAWSPDGRLVASANHGAGLTVLDASNGRFISQPIKVHDRDSAACVAFSPDSRLCAGGGQAQACWIHDARTGTELAFWHAHEDNAAAISFSPDGQYVLSGDGGSRSTASKLCLWHATSHQLIRSFDTAGVVDRVAFSSDGRRAFSAGDGMIRVWDVQSGRLLRTIWGNERGILNVALLPDRNLALSGADDGSVRLWGLDSPPSPLLANYDRGMNCIAISPDDRFLAVGGEGVLNMLDGGGKLIAPLENSGKKVKASAISPDGRLVVAGSGDGEVVLFRTDTKKKLFTLGYHDLDIRTIAFSADADLVLTANGNSAKLWDTRDCKNRWTLKGSATLLPGAQFVDGGRRALMMTVHGRVTCLDVNSASESDGCQMDVPWDLTSNVIYLDNGKRVLGACGPMIFIWDANSGRRLVTFTGHTFNATALAISPDGRWLASGSPDNTLRIWDMASGRELHPFPEPAAIRALTWSHDGRRLYMVDAVGHFCCFDFSTASFHARL